MELKGYKGVATIHKPAIAPKRDADDAGEPAIVTVPDAIFGNLVQERDTADIAAAVASAKLCDVVVTTAAAVSPSPTTFAGGTGAAVLTHACALAELLGLRETDLPDALFRSVDIADMARAKPKCGALYSPSRHSTEGAVPLHVHFGLGRLAIGLVLPSLMKGSARVAVMQRASSLWKPLADSARNTSAAAGATATSAAADASKGKGGGGDDAFLGLKQVTVRVNGAHITPLSVVTDATALDAALDTAGAAAIGLKAADITTDAAPPPMLVISDDGAVVRRLVRAATSISCAVGTAVARAIAPALAHLDDEPDPTRRPILYACENDFGPVRDLRGQVAGKVHVVECMVDRVCMSRTVDADIATINATAEPWDGRIVVLEPGLDHRLVPFGGDVVVPPDADAAHFLYEQKFQLVNGAHGILSFLTLRDAGVTPDKLNGIMAEEGSLRLLQPRGMPPEALRDLHDWQALRSAYLINKYGIETMARALGGSVDQHEGQVFNALCEYNAQVERRLNEVTDDVARSMESDPKRMLLQRLLPLRDFAMRFDTRNDMAAIGGGIDASGADASGGSGGGGGGGGSGSGGGDGGSASSGDRAGAAQRYLDYVSVDVHAARARLDKLCDWADELCGGDGGGGSGGGGSKERGGGATAGSAEKRVVEQEAPRVQEVALMR